MKWLVARRETVAEWMRTNIDPRTDPTVQDMWTSGGEKNCNIGCRFAIGEAIGFLHCRILTKPSDGVTEGADLNALPQASSMMSCRVMSPML